TGLCNSGTSTSPYLSGSRWIWSCSGSNGGSTSNCYANKGADPVNGQCGSANGGTFVDAPITGLCNSGTSTSPYLSGSRWIWSCSGSNGGSTSNCYANKGADPINGQCGSSNGGSFTSRPTTGLCNSGTESSVSGSGPWSWSCAGSNGGTTAHCSADKVNVVNGKCGCAHGQTYAVAPISCLCTSGTPTIVSLTATNTWTWTCKGESTGTDECCTAYKSVVNTRPTVDAGSDLEIEAGERSIAINAVATDPDNDPLTYSWRCSNGTLSNWAALETVFTAPATINYSTAYTCTITVNDGRGGTANDSVNIRVTVQKVNGECSDINGTIVESKPAINLCKSGNASTVAGNNPWTWTCSGLNGGTSATCSASKVNSDPEITIVGTREVNERQAILLRASATDKDGDTLTYSWSCSGGNLSNSRVVMPYYTAPSLNNVNRTHSCNLTVNDGKGGYDSDSVSILIRTYATSTNNIPVVNVADNKEVKSGQSIVLTGTASDPDGDNLTYSWSCNGGTLSNRTSLNPTFTALSGIFGNSSYTCTLTANDGKGGYASDSLSIVVRPSITTKNSAPVLSVANDREINPGQEVRLFALAYDPDGDPLTYKWTCNGGSLSDDTNYITTFIPYSGSTSTYYSCKVVVSDGKTSTSDNIRISVRNINNNPINGTPVVEAGNDKELNQGQTIIFNPTANDPNGGSLAYSWSCTQGMLSSNNILNPSYTAQYNSGVSTCTLTVRNERGASASDSFSIKIRETVNN
ncbi:MAG: PKD domain-containing protein, partial [Candidatus Pacebacteria bacterium]|nr:PKD domain-containing protein [Candidatus Paceibacterota bacterium]